MKVGVAAFRFNHYSTARSIVGVVPEARYLPVQDLYSCVNLSTQRLNRLAGRQLASTFDLNNQFNDLNLNRVDLVHLFNAISYARKPWLTSFETLVPRFRAALRPEETDPKEVDKVRRGLECLAGKACRRLIALSACSAGIERDLLARFPEFQPEIEKKLVVLHPGQATLMAGYEDKPTSRSGRLRFMFAGSAFFRKGGREIVDCLLKLRRELGDCLELVLVSSFKIEDYATRETPEDVRRYQALVHENSDWIEFHPFLPNAELLALARGSQVGLLPTHADSYGYSMLEFQACGCPVISTDVRALPEINNDQVGWLIPVPKHPLGEARYNSVEERQQLSQAISHGLESAVRSILNDPQSVRVKGGLALERIRREHDPLERAEKLRNWYAEALAS